MRIECLSLLVFHLSIPCTKITFFVLVPRLPKHSLMQNIVYLLLNDGIPIQQNEKLDRIVPHLEEVGGSFVKNNAAVKGGFRLIKTHLVSEKNC